MSESPNRPIFVPAGHVTGKRIIIPYGFDPGKRYRNKRTNPLGRRFARAERAGKTFYQPWVWVRDKFKKIIGRQRTAPPGAFFEDHYGAEYQVQRDGSIRKVSDAPKL